MERIVVVAVLFIDADLVVAAVTSDTQIFCHAPAAVPAWVEKAANVTPCVRGCENFFCVQIAAGAVPTVLVLDVQSLLETPEGGELLRAELRYLLEDPTICKVKCTVMNPHSRRHLSSASSRRADWPAHGHRGTLWLA